MGNNFFQKWEMFEWELGLLCRPRVTYGGGVAVQQFPLLVCYNNIEWGGTMEHRSMSPPFIRPLAMNGRPFLFHRLPPLSSLACGRVGDRCTQRPAVWAPHTDGTRSVHSDGRADSLSAFYAWSRASSWWDFHQFSHWKWYPLLLLGVDWAVGTETPSVRRACNSIISAIF